MAFLSLFCAACQSRGWDKATYAFSHEGCQSARTCLYSDEFCSSMMLEIVRTIRGVRLYLNLCTFSLSHEEVSSLSIPVEVTIREEVFSVPLHCFAGGQRLLFSPEAAHWLIEHLCLGDDILIRIGRVQAHFCPTGFFDAWEGVMAPIMIEGESLKVYEDRSSPFGSVYR